MNAFPTECQVVLHILLVLLRLSRTFVSIHYSLVPYLLTTGTIAMENGTRFVHVVSGQSSVDVSRSRCSGQGYQSHFNIRLV
jgi:hypothetical protein